MFNFWWRKPKILGTWKLEEQYILKEDWQKLPIIWSYKFINDTSWNNVEKVGKIYHCFGGNYIYKRDYTSSTFPYTYIEEKIFSDKETNLNSKTVFSCYVNNNKLEIIGTLPSGLKIREVWEKDNFKKENDDSKPIGKKP